MGKSVIPESLLTELRKQGYSDDVIRELYKWYDSSEHKGVASF